MTKKKVKKKVKEYAIASANENILYPDDIIYNGKKIKTVKQHIED